MSPGRSALQRVRRGYRAAALMLLNTVLVLLFVQVALGLVLWAKDRSVVADDLYADLGDDRMTELYPQQSRAEVARLWGALVVPFVYEPFSEFMEQPRTTPFVNVDAAGFRRIAAQGPWPPEPHRINVFVFGGSTTFGYGVADDDTIPSHLQRLLQTRAADVRVYNFGRGYYYSTQERIVFEQLLMAGRVPAVAIFIDGLNDFGYEQDDAMISPLLAAAVAAGGKVSFADWLGGTPMGRVSRFAVDRLAASRETTDRSIAEPSDEAMHRIIDRYLANKRLIEAASSAYGVIPIFVWQPVPMYHYDLRSHLFAHRGFGFMARVRRGYEVMADATREHPIGGHFLWLADVQEASREPLYVDIVHYTPSFSARLAGLIDDRIGDVVRDAQRGR